MRRRGFEKVGAYDSDSVVLPTRKTKQSAGYDLAAAEKCVVAPGEVFLVPTGVKAYMQPDETLKIYIRSSLATKKHLALANGVGVIDADYYGNAKNEGHIFVALTNFGDEAVTIEKGERFAQGIFEKYLTIDDDEADGVREGGFGSTG